MTPIVSVVIPAHNAARTVRDAIRSALTQTVSDLEVVVVDDGSTDATAAEAQAVDDPRVRVISQPNGGAASARNTGMGRAVGTYVALLDADDLWLPDKLERQLAALRKTPNAHAVQTGAFFVDDDLQTLSIRPCRPTRDALLETLRFQNMPNNMSTLLLHRERILEQGGFDESLVILEEWDMHLKAARFLNLISVERPLSLYRVHAGNRSRDLDIHIEPGHRILERVFDDPGLPTHVRRRRAEIYARFFTMLAGGSFRIGQYGTAVAWGTKAMRTHPVAVGYVAALPLRRLQRKSSLSDGPQAFRLDHGRVVPA
jgi:glycosyltransferase involved in cell wall biosynthesis